MSLFNLVANNNTLKFEITTKYPIRFDLTKKTIASLIGFDNKAYKANVKLKSLNNIAIANYNLLWLNCNISHGSYINGIADHSLFYSVAA